MYYGYGKKKLRLEKKSHDQKLQERKKIPYTRFQRVTAQVQVEGSEQIINGRIFLHDLSEIGVSAFMTEPVRKGTKVFLVIEQPRHFFMRAEVAWCALFRLNTRVISAENFQYRVGLRFIYDDAVDREVVRNYFNDIVDV